MSEEALMKSNQSLVQASGASTEVAAQSEIEACVKVAINIPRDGRKSLASVDDMLKASPKLADKGLYLFPRGKKKVKGIGAVLAREMAREWRNIDYGWIVVGEGDTHRHIRAYAWDMETNTRTKADAIFEKKIFRKGRGMIVPDERDLRELTNRHAAIAVRNCILSLLPHWFKTEIEDRAYGAVLKMSAGKEKAQEIEERFEGINVTRGMLEKFIGKELEMANPEDIAELRMTYASISDGHTSIDDHFADFEEEQVEVTLGEMELDDSDEANRGHDDEGLASMVESPDAQETEVVDEEAPENAPESVEEPEPEPEVVEQPKKAKAKPEPEKKAKESAPKEGSLPPLDPASKRVKTDLHKWFTAKYGEDYKKDFQKATKGALGIDAVDINSLSRDEAKALAEALQGE